MTTKNFHMLVTEIQAMGFRIEALGRMPGAYEQWTCRVINDTTKQDGWGKGTMPLEAMQNCINGLVAKGKAQPVEDDFDDLV